MVTKSQQVAVQVGAISAMLPSLLAVGLPLPNREHAAAAAGDLERRARALLIVCLRGVLLQGRGFAELWPQLVGARAARAADHHRDHAEVPKEARLMRAQLFAVVKKELRQTVRDRRMLSMLIIAPVLQLTLLGFAVDLDVDHIETAIVDQDGTRTSRELIAGLAADPTLEVVLTTDDADRPLTNGEAARGAGGAAWLRARPRARTARTAAGAGRRHQPDPSAGGRRRRAALPAGAGVGALRGADVDASWVDRRGAALRVDHRSSPASSTTRR